jgi:molybdopterin synthase sulfur carrier subunit
MIQLKYFGAIAEETKSKEEEFPFMEMTLKQLMENLEQKYPLKKLSFSIAVNQKIIRDKENYKLENNDIIALLPPFAGG